MGTKPACFLIGLSMLLSLGACAAPYGEDAERGTREEAVKSAEQTGQEKENTPSWEQTLLERWARTALSIIKAAPT